MWSRISLWLTICRWQTRDVCTFCGQEMFCTCAIFMAMSEWGESVHEKMFCGHLGLSIGSSYWICASLFTSLMPKENRKTAKEKEQTEKRAEQGQTDDLMETICKRCKATVYFFEPRCTNCPAKRPSKKVRSNNSRSETYQANETWVDMLWLSQFILSRLIHTHLVVHTFIALAINLSWINAWFLCFKSKLFRSINHTRRHNCRIMCKKDVIHSMSYTHTYINT